MNRLRAQTAALLALRLNRTRLPGLPSQAHAAGLGDDGAAEPADLATEVGRSRLLSSAAYTCCQQGSSLRWPSCCCWLLCLLHAAAPRVATVLWQ